MNYRDLNDEMRAHLDEKVADLVESGMSESDARERAMREFGNRTLHLEDSRAVWRWAWLDQAAQDLRHALRGMRRSPGFTAVVVATLALGIGANTAIFSLVNQLLLHPAAVTNPERIVAIGTEYKKLNLHFVGGSVPTMADVRDDREVFEHAALVAGNNVNYADGDTPEMLQASAVSVEWFDVFGARPLLGRVFRPEEDQPNANRVVVLAYVTWTRLFGGDRAVLGRKILLNQIPYEVIGVMPPGFRYPDTTDLWTPAGLPPDQFANANRFNERHQIMARVRGGIPAQRVNAAVAVLAERAKSANAVARDSNWGLFAVPFTDTVAGTSKTPVLVLAGAVGFVLLIACSNIAGLMLARASARAREFAVRSALGASRRRLLRVILSESMVFAIAGGAAGLALAYGAMQVLLLLAPEGTTAGLTPSLDVYVLLFCAGIVIVSGALFGILPAWRISRSNPNDALKGARASTSDAARQRLRSALVVAETALALMLLVSAGLFLRSFLRLEDVNPGFNSHGVMTASFALPRRPPPIVETRAAFFRAVVEPLKRRPGVAAVAIGYPIPFSGITNAGGFTIEGHMLQPGDPGPHGDMRYVTPEYFEALAIPIKSGRIFTDLDRSKTEPVVVIDDNVAQRYLPDENPVGKRLIRAGMTYTIIGVVGHVMHDDLSDAGRGAVYFAMFQQGIPTGAVVVKTSGDAGTLAPAIRAAVREADPQQAVFAVRPLDELVAKSLAPRRFAVRLLGFFGAVALFLAALGLYGVISYSVAQRTREIGIRVALGAERRAVIGQVVGQGLRMAGIGVGIGIAGAVLCGRLLSTELFGVTAFDPVTLIAMAAALLGSAAIASYLPALRAARVDPVTALREE